MAAAQALNIQTIVNLKRALAEPDDVSESENSIAYTSNRGRKLKRRARYVHEGKLDDGKGRNGFKEEVEYFGKRRKIIYRKENRRKKIAIESEDEDEEDSQDDAGSSSETMDPYEDVKIDEILAPIESAADLPSHPSLSHIYLSRTLNELIQQSLDKICAENTHTSKLKNLFTKFLGDDPFVNLEKMVWKEEDHELVARQRGDALLGHLGGLDNTNGVGLGLTSGLPGGEGPSRLTNGDATMAQSEDTPMVEANGHSSLPSETNRSGRNTDVSNSTSQHKPTSKGDGKDIHLPRDDTIDEENGAPEDESATQEEQHGDGNEDQRQQTPPTARRMTTRSVTNNHASPVPTSPPLEIDTFFFPPSYRVDPDYGLPHAEAEETRKLLFMATQKQDEFVRGLNRVRADLLRAENLRKKVWSWCRSMEGMRAYHQHLSEVSGNPGKWDIDEGENVGLSDGEDWYDREEWNLDGPLEKGREEEDEEMLPQGKKTRGRK